MLAEAEVITRLPGVEKPLSATVVLAFVLARAAEPQDGRRSVISTPSAKLRGCEKLAAALRQVSGRAAKYLNSIAAHRRGEHVEP